jgi:hypothetical protein
VISGSVRGFRGGSWINNNGHLSSGFRGNGEPAFESYIVGFRVAIVPEPSVAGLMGLGAFLLYRKRK